MPSAHPAKRRSFDWLENIKTIVYAGLIAIGIRTLAFEPFNIPSGSMVPTLLVGDYLLVSKYTYGYSHFSLPLSPDLFSGRILGHAPQRGDVVVFRVPYDTSIDYIKRVIGLPGDRVQMQKGQLFINGTQVKRDQAGPYQFVDEHGQQYEAERYVEHLPNGVDHGILKARSDDPVNNTGVYTVPDGYVFCMGDNRDFSADSRYDPSGVPPFLRGSEGVGLLPVENLVGKAQVIFFSVDATAPLWQIWQWPFEIRWSRLFRVLH